ncbi:recombinase family protein [Glaciimonas sp. PCH181]|uniref:recombinase family protein n=1 Tax=Glaciimonas sp. PCH181 TaxID=2133943 RepID=UPI001CEC4280|nr:recombinase family protein [Glaciimonas sp. PCH181]
MAVFAYRCVSTKDQTTENQQSEIERAGYNVDFWFSDEGVSGKMSASQRPQFGRVLGQICDRIWQSSQRPPRCFESGRRR